MVLSCDRWDIITLVHVLVEFYVEYVANAHLPFGRSDHLIDTPYGVQIALVGVIASLVW
jgi:hypothetical protein